MKTLIKKCIPKSVLAFYYKALSYIGAWWHRHPSEKLIVIGVTGTKGKTTVVNLIASILEHVGFKAGFTSTANFKIGAEERLNNFLMTMPGRFALQKILRDMVDAGCRYAVIESSSEGVLQFRHLNIHYDVMVFTNLTSEHLERHGGFENYKQAKLEYFRHLARLPHKVINGERVPKAMAVNGDNEHAADFLKFSVDKKIAFSADAVGLRRLSVDRVIEARDIRTAQDAVSFQIENVGFIFRMPGRFNVENCLAAVSAVFTQGVSLKQCAEALIQADGVPGRMEFIEAGRDLKVLVDYAHEPRSMQLLYDTVKPWKKQRIIHVFGSMGGGRDSDRRPILGGMAAKMADIVILTDESSYDENPDKIIAEIAQGALREGKVEGRDLYKISDRRLAIRKAFALAQEGDLVLITGKGAEQAIAGAGGKMIPWDDRKVAREELRKVILQHKGEA